jgi:uncharacterized protein (DUF697 family)/tellurite resistance protein
MDTTQQQALLTLALYAAMADGQKAEAERDQLRALAEQLADADAHALVPKVYQDVLLKRVSVEQAAAALTDPAHRLLAYEMAVCVCDADGHTSTLEKAFLSQLQRTLALAPSSAAEVQATTSAADAIAEEIEHPHLEPTYPSVLVPAAATAAAATAAVAASPSAAVAVSPSAAAPTAAAARPTTPELDKMVLNYAILCGALELLPQSWASMAILPLQVKMVYRIGKAHGYTLDQGHIKEFVAAAGVGLTSQYLEQFGRKLLGGLLGKAAGRTVGRLGSAATGMAFSFATTYALGQLGQRYYAGGRQMSTDLLRQTFSGLLGPARQMQTQYLPQIQQKAATLNPADVMAMVRG